MIGELERVHYASERFQAVLWRSLAITQRALDTSKRPYVAFSGGKDSLALMIMVGLTAPEVPLVWGDDELEYPETVEYMTLLQGLDAGQLIITTSTAEHAGWFTPWIDEPYWREPLMGTLNSGVPPDEWMAEQGYDLTFTGIRMAENRRRRDWLVQSGADYRVNTGTGRRCCPLKDWTEDDVWALIAHHRVPYNAAYDVYDQINVPRKVQRVGPLPLARRQHLEDGWPELFERLRERYGERWTS